MCFATHGLIDNKLSGSAESVLASSEPEALALWLDLM